MDKVLFSCWKGKVTDNRGKKPEEFEPPEGLPDKVLEKLKDESSKAIMDLDGFVIKDPDASILDLCVDYLGRTWKRSCGKCIPCRIGTRVLYDMLRDISEGKGKKGDLETLKSLADTLKVSTKCKIGHSAPAPVLDAMTYFKDAFQQEVEKKREAGGRK